MSESISFEFIGGELCLDFANTVGGTREGGPTENLTDYATLVAWSRQVGLITIDEGEQLLREAQRQPEMAQAVLERARLLRESIFTIFSRLDLGKKPEMGDIETLNRELARSMGRVQVVQQADDFTWGWQREPLSLDWMLGPIARSAADLLTSDELPRVRECANASCDWLFVDRSRNHSRQWCDMKSCGNVSKVRRYRARKRS
jgi:predicted RNA-binding Zn ribbon-like protein